MTFRPHKCRLRFETRSIEYSRSCNGRSSRSVQYRRRLQTTTFYAQNPLDTFPRNFPIDGKVANLLPTRCLLCSVVSQIPLHCNGIWETTRHNRHNGLLTAPTCYRLDMDLSFMLRSCGLVHTCPRPHWRYSRRIRRQSPFSVTVAEFGDSRRICRNSATIVTSVDRAVRTCLRHNGEVANFLRTCYGEVV